MFSREDLEAALSRGWVLMPLDGKKPVLKDWQKRGAPDIDTLERWAAAGNLGLCTGQSGLLVLDCDPRHGAQPFDLDLPDTLTVETGGGGWHFYFQMPDPPVGNKAGILPGWDVRGVGGQVVYPGSVHPETGDMYRWMNDDPILPVPDAILAMIRPPERAPVAPAPQRPASNGSNGGGGGYARAALEREAAAVASAPEGSRNHTLNRAAFSLGQLVASGDLSADEVTHALMAACGQCGLSDREARLTIASGFRSGQSKPRPPRAAPQRQQRTHTPATTTVTTPQPTGSPVLIPGCHVTDTGEYLEVGADRFAAAVLAALPIGAIYRRSCIVGRVVGPQGARRFEPISIAAMRIVVDAHVSLGRWRSGGKDPPEMIYLSCTADLATLVLAAAQTDPVVAEITLMVSYPVVTKCGISPAGFANGVYYDQPVDLDGLTPRAEGAVQILTDLVVDFPFADPASRVNFFGLLLTPILRPMIRNAPLHLVMASLPRTGKTKLIDEVLGGVLLGHPTPALQLSGSDEERDKRILAALLRGDTIRHLDNLRDTLDSAVLASLLTAPIYSGRTLGRSELVDLPNTLCLIGSGNNVRATTEIVERSIPIVLQPHQVDPSQRTDFRHPDLPAYVASQRRVVLAALLGLIESWRAAGSAPASDRIGGFEDWARIVGGVLRHAGLTDWLGNAKEWRRKADPHGSDMAEFIALWVSIGGSHQAKDLAKIAEEAGLFPQCWTSNSERGRVTSFARKVLAAHLDAPVGSGFYVRRSGHSSNSLWRLEGDHQIGGSNHAHENGPRSQESQEEWAF